MQNFLNKYPFLQVEVLNNAILNWFIALGVLILVYLVLKIFKASVVSRLKKLSKKTKTEIDDIMIAGIDSISWLFYVLTSVYVSLQFLNVSEIVNKIAYYVFLVAVVYYVIKFLSKIVDHITKIMIKKGEEHGDNVSIIRLINTIIKMMLWVGAVVLILSNMGYNVTSLIAGLGIGGVAIALAVQNILGDLFSSLAIYFDKPFKVGDFVAIGDQTGTVTKVGLKTTRIQVPQGEELVIANSELTSAQLRNFGVMTRRRVLFNIGVTYDTPHKKLQAIPEILKKVIETSKETEVDRIHFKNFGDSSLGYEIVYYVNSGEYVDYMNVQQEINLAIVEQFEKEGIEMAFPTQTVYVKK